MIKVKIICLGKLKESGYKQLEQEYSKRLTQFYKYELIELSEEPYFDNSDLDKVKAIEWEKIKKYIKPEDLLITLEESGNMYDSIQFAQFIDTNSNLGQSLCFVMGSGLGLSKEAIRQSKYTISLSKLTFPHNMARVILIEQLYRAGTILTGSSYHK